MKQHMKLYKVALEISAMSKVDAEELLNDYTGLHTHIKILKITEVKK